MDGILGGSIGAMVGVIGGVLGTYLAYRNTKSDGERALVVRGAIAVWTGVLVFVVLFLVVPAPYKHFLWIPYVVLLILGIRIWNQKQLQLREDHES
ncbi:MAG: hypothetical protein OES25_05075 [Acidobacteriota bacterium]|nr:hypothetical protein [Acidobacteriota bacterium]